MRSYVIHLLRNMPCEGNLEGRYIGRTESPLAASSLRDLVSLKQKYRYPEAAAFYASPSTRCVDTLKILYPQADPEVILEMAECDFAGPPVSQLDGAGRQCGPAQWGKRPGVFAAGVQGV